MCGSGAVGQKTIKSGMRKFGSGTYTLYPRSSEPLKAKPRYFQADAPVFVSSFLSNHEAFRLKTVKKFLVSDHQVWNHGVIKAQITAKIPEHDPL